MRQKAQIQDLTDLPMSRLMLQKYSYCLHIVDMIFFLYYMITCTKVMLIVKPSSFRSFEKFNEKEQIGLGI